jgi:hypothetical protein
MLSGILTIVLAGSLTGCALGSVLMRMILSLTLDGTSSFYAADTRYSSAVTGLVKTIEPVYPSSILILLICTFVVSFDGNDFTTNFTASLSCISNVGPGLAKVGPKYNYAGFSNLSKIVMSVTMLAGRLEIYPVLILLMPKKTGRG